MNFEIEDPEICCRFAVEGTTRKILDQRGDSIVSKMT